MIHFSSLSAIHRKRIKALFISISEKSQCLTINKLIFYLSEMIQPPVINEVEENTIWILFGIEVFFILILNDNISNLMGKFPSWKFNLALKETKLVNNYGGFEDLFFGKLKKITANEPLMFY